MPALDETLLTALKEERAAIAREMGDVPRFQIFSDRVLISFARLKPRSVEAGRRISGVGEMKAKQFLDRFLAVIARNESGAPGPD